MRKRIVSADCLTEFWRTLTDEEKLSLADNSSLLKRFLARLAKKAAKNMFVMSFSDEEAVKWLVEHKKYDEPVAKLVIAKWRAYAATFGYTGPVAWAVKEGFTLKSHASFAGPCYDKLNYLQSWSLQNDEATKTSLVFWVPRLVEGSLGKSITQMEALRTELKQRYELPEHHVTNFGSIALLFALILAYFKFKGERVPLKMFYAASDTFHAVGNRLIAGRFGEGGLLCGYWDGGAGGRVGFFLLGVELGE